MDDSGWGYIQTALTAPSGIQDSGWAITHFPMQGPDMVGDGQWAYASGRVRAPHHPFGVFTGLGVAYVNVETKAP